MSHKWAWAWVALLGCGRVDDAAAPAESAAAAAPVVASAAVRWVEVQPPAHDVALFEVPAWIVQGPTGHADVAVTARVRVVKVAVRAGDTVTAGQTVAEVEAPDLVQAAATRRSAEARIAAHLRHVTGLRSMQREGLVRTAEVFQIEMQLADLHAVRAEAEARLRGAGVADADVPALLTTGRWLLRAPIAGVVREVTAVPGAVIEPPNRLATLDAPQNGRAEVHLHHALPPGARLTLVLADGTALPLDPTPVATTVDGADGSTVAWFDTLPATSLPAGTRGVVRVAGLAADVLQVPARALLYREGKAQVIVQRGAVGQQVDVVVIASAGAIALVRGLRAGERVAAEADRALPPPVAEP